MRRGGGAGHPGPPTAGGGGVITGWTPVAAGDHGDTGAPGAAFGPPVFIGCVTAASQVKRLALVRSAYGSATAVWGA